MFVLMIALMASPASAEYLLRFLSDFQDGEYDTDAAEHIAYDTQSHRAFVASAESIRVNVVDFSDPTSPTTSGSIGVAADLSFSCEEVDCIYEVMDFGGAGAPCGFADTLKIVHDRPDFECCDWFDGEFVLDESMVSPEDCQRLCQEEPSCSFFSFENECQTDPATNACNSTIRHNECYLKSAYSQSAAVSAGLSSSADCTAYVAWESGPSYDLHAYDENWVGASGPVVCGNVQSESVQSVQTVSVDGYDNTIVVAAAPHVLEFANGYLAFYDATSLNFLGCAEAGNKPEGITASGNLLSCINEGSAREDGLVDHEGSMTMCEMSTSFNPVMVNFDCANYHFTEENFEEGAWASAIELRSRNLRLYGPNADDIGLDLEPEHGGFVLDGAGLVVSFQDNNGYAFFDTASKKYTYIGGYGYIPATLDASDRDGRINIKSDWQGTALWGMPMPDQIASVVVGGTTYILTANEGGTRDGEDIIGAAEAADGTEIEGEEVRYGDLGVPDPVATCDSCAGEEELGRLLTVPFMPSDFATNACGLNSCSAEELAMGLDSSSFSCLYNGADYGGDTDGLCDFAPNPTDAYFVNTAEWEAPGWYSGTVTVDETMTSPEACQALCAASSTCDFFSYEFELGVHECLFKLENDCAYDKYVRWWQHWEDPNWVGFSGPAVCPFDKAPYTSATDASDISGSPGGSISVGARSFSIWKMSSLSDPLELVFDSGSKFEEITSHVANGLCDGCLEASSCDVDACPFNSDSAAPPSMDARSDAKGPEPECVTVGTMSDGTVLSFVGLERTGGIVVYDISDPENPVYQDFLNVRNWLVDESFDEDSENFSEQMVSYALNDGPESLVFLDAEMSPIGREMLIAVAPLAGRTTAYIIETGEMRQDDGSCSTIANCQYIPTSLGGTGAALGLTFQDVCVGESCDTTSVGGGEEGEMGGGSTSKKKKSENADDLIVVVAVMCVLVLVALCVAASLFFRAKKYENKFKTLSIQQNAIHEMSDVQQKTEDI